jgi:curved DNA-binding protein
MAFVDYYKILGVDKNIPQKDVRAAYRKRAKQFHPDLHPNDPKAKAKFQALNEAYEVISDPDKRAKYDQYGEQWKNADAFGGFGGAGGAGGSGSYGGAGGNPFEGFDFSQFGGGGGFSSFFENLFGGRGRSQQSAGGFGSGNFGGFNGSAGYGSGFNGAGYGAGADFGTGGCGQNGRANNGEMNMNVNIDLYTALLGGEGIIKLSNGSKIKLKIKPETQNGTKVRVRGKGYDRGDGTFGDLMITYNVKLPTGLNEKQKDLLRQMKDAK